MKPGTRVRGVVKIFIDEMRTRVDFGACHSS